MVLKLLSLILPGLLLLTNITMVVEPQERLTDRIIFVVDRSGSMHGDTFSRALQVVTETLQQPVDQYEIGVIAFNDSFARWPGKPENGPKAVPPNWAAMPSNAVVREVNDWLEALGAGGDTLVMPALRGALLDPRERLSIVLITDGQFGRERTSDIVENIEKLQQERIKQGWGRAIILAYGISSVGTQPSLKAIGEVGQGGYLLEQPEPEFPEFDFFKD